MATSQSFDFNQPTREALAGVYIESSDGVNGTVPAAAALPQAIPGQTPPRPEDLFGHTVTLDDNNGGEQAKGPQKARR